MPGVKLKVAQLMTREHRGARNRDRLIAGFNPNMIRLYRQISSRVALQYI